MNIIGIHELNENIIHNINNNYANNILTFDDGLFTQFLFKDKINNKKRIYFICPSLVNIVNEQSSNFVLCTEAMTEHFRNHNNKYYMNINQIKILLTEGYEIGAHSFYHRHIKYETNSDTIKHYMSNTKGSLLCVKNDEYIKNDTEQMLNWFNINLNIIPNKYCYPFNQKTEKLETILQQYGFNDFYDNTNRYML